MGAATVAVGMEGVVAVTAAEAGGMAAAVLMAVTAEGEEGAEEGRAVAVGAMVVAKVAGAGRHCRRR